VSDELTKPRIQEGALLEGRQENVLLEGGWYGNTEKYRDSYFTSTKSFQVTNYASAIYTYWFVEGWRYHISHLSPHHIPNPPYPLNEETTMAGWTIDSIVGEGGVKMRTKDLDGYLADGTFVDWRRMTAEEIEAESAALKEKITLQMAAAGRR